LKLLVELYLDPDIASPRKVSVWYSFWGEASSRQEYYDICGQKDEGFAVLVRELIERVILKSGLAHLDADAVALGLIGVLEMLWQDFAFKDEADIDRPAARERAMAYLRSVFPGQFTASDAGAGGAAASPCIWAYDSARLYAMEREHIFQNAWQFIAHRADLERVGDFVSSDLGFDRALIVRAGDGELRAFRNSCPAAPHALIAPGRGQLRDIQCAVHALSFGLDGIAVLGDIDLLPMQVTRCGDLVLVRSADRLTGAGFPDPWPELEIAPGARALPARADIPIAADWKVVAELVLSVGASPMTEGWSARCYQHLTTHSPAAARQHFLAPNHWVSLRPDGWTLLQILPTGPGRSSLRHHGYTWCGADAPARAAQYLAGRLWAIERASGAGVAESIQRGMVNLGHEASHVRGADVSAFHRQLLAMLPVMGLDEPAGDF
jgi:nitrite reductase/ring-hydroxylating ferredoxin subunit